MTPLATIDCGDHCEDTLRAVRSETGSVALEREFKGGRIERWPVEATDTLRVTGAMLGNAGIEWKLTLVSRCGSSSAIAHFDRDIDAFVTAVAAAAGCAVSIASRR